MKKTTKIVVTTVLVLGVTSAVFAFGANHFANMSMQDKAEMFSHHIDGKLDLTDVQEGKLDQLITRVSELMQKAHNERESHEQMVDELITDQPLDQSFILQKINSKTEMVNSNAPEVVALLAGFVDSLDAEQKKELKEMIGHRKGGRFGRHSMN